MMNNPIAVLSLLALFLVLAPTGQADPFMSVKQNNQQPQQQLHQPILPGSNSNSINGPIPNQNQNQQLQQQHGPLNQFGQRTDFNQQPGQFSSQGQFGSQTQFPLYGPPQAFGPHNPYYLGPHPFWPNQQPQLQQNESGLMNGVPLNQQHLGGMPFGPMNPTFGFNNNMNPYQQQQMHQMPQYQQLGMMPWNQQGYNQGFNAGFNGGQMQFQNHHQQQKYPFSGSWQDPNINYNSNPSTLNGQQQQHFQTPSQVTDGRSTITNQNLG